VKQRGIQLMATSRSLTEGSGNAAFSGVANHPNCWAKDVARRALTVASAAKGLVKGQNLAGGRGGIIGSGIT
jgi:hypothetical protein